MLYLGPTPYQDMYGSPSPWAVQRVAVTTTTTDQGRTMFLSDTSEVLLELGVVPGEVRAPNQKLSMLRQQELYARKHPDHDRLVAELVRHLKGEPGLPAFPKIAEDRVPLADNLRVCVSWDDWAGVSETERSVIIHEAYKQARGMPEMLRISVAMGLTPLEAKQRGIDLDG